MSPKPTIHEIAQKAMAVFHQNTDTLVAGFLIRHPDTDPADVELVFTPGRDGVIRFSIEPKEMHVPPRTDDPTADITESDEHFARREGYADGWNDCRQAMIDQAKSFRAPEAMVSTLEAVDG